MQTTIKKFSKTQLISGLVFLFISLKSNVFSQQTDKALLWEISGNGLEKPSYIFGTIHLICPEDFFIPKGFDEKFKTTQQTYLEIDMDDPQLMAKSQKAMFSSDGKKLKDLMKPTDYKEFSDFFKKTTGMSTEMFGTAKPFTFMSLTMMKSLDCLLPKSYEEYFVKQSQEAKKEVLGLETVEEQMAVIDKVPTDLQLEWLMESVKEMDKMKLMYKDLLVIYQNQDLEGMSKFMAENMVGTKGFEDELLDKRNERWIPLIEKFSKEKPTFFAVGAGHLGGKKGVLNLLKQKGFSIKPIF